MSEAINPIGSGGGSTRPIGTGTNFVGPTPQVAPAGNVQETGLTGEVQNPTDVVGISAPEDEATSSNAANVISALSGMEPVGSPTNGGSFAISQAGEAGMNAGGMGDPGMSAGGVFLNKPPAA